MAEREKPQFAEDEDMERARAFWKANGNSIVGGLVLGLAIILGYNFWQNYQQSQGENASILYEQLSVADDVDGVANNLMSNYESSPYATLGALIAAKNAMDAEDVEKAKTYLNWVLEKSKDEGMQHIARLRLGYALILENNPGEAKSLLEIEDMSTFASRYHELIGDANVQLGLISEARESYQLSLDDLTTSAASRQMIQLKLENTNGA